MRCCDLLENKGPVLEVMNGLPTCHFDVVVVHELAVTLAAVSVLFDLMVLEGLLGRLVIVAEFAFPPVKVVFGAHVLPSSMLVDEVLIAGIALEIGHGVSG